jgi:hypothetical protein
MASLCEKSGWLRFGCGTGFVSRFAPERPQGDAIELVRFQCDFFCEQGLVTLGDFVFNGARNPLGDLAFVSPRTYNLNATNRFLRVP